MTSRDYPPMSISAITTATTVFPPSPPVSNYKTFDRQQQQQHSLGPPLISPHDHSPPSSPHSVSFSAMSSPKQQEQQQKHTPLSLQERRLRNKAASAKYRQKKNQLQNEMREMISQLSERNAVLERQVEELKAENDKLRQSADRLRGKIFARKMLRQWIGRHKHQPSSSSTTSSTSSALSPCIKSQQDLDLNIDLDNVDEDDVDDLMA